MAAILTSSHYNVYNNNDDNNNNNNNNNDFRLCHIIHYTDDPESKGLLVPNFFNEPNEMDDADDISCTMAFDWGKEWYLKHYPVLDRSKSDRDCIFKRDFIRNSVKRNEVNKK